MASAYGYITAANLEGYTGISYSTVDAVFTATLVESHISQGERWINTICGQSFATTFPDAVVFLTYVWASRSLHNAILNLGITGVVKGEKFAEMLTEEEEMMLEPFKIVESAIRSVWWQ